MIVTRMAPSPTGKMHIGSLRTAIYNYALAKANGGKFILRIEDTDQERCTKEDADDIINLLGVFKIKPDEVYTQSKRLDIYREHTQFLINKGDAYWCKCVEDVCICGGSKVKENDRSVLRIRMPKENIVSHDYFAGDISFSPDHMGKDQIIIKSNGFPTYHFAVVVDDHLMGVTHVLRGQEWLSSLPKHSYIYRLFGWEEPVWCHLSVILSEDGGKLSKRKGDFSVNNYLNKGYMIEAITNYASSLGYSNEYELYSLSRICNVFDMKKLSNVNPQFDMKKFNSINRQYMKMENYMEKYYKHIMTMYKSMYSDYEDGIIKLNKCFEYYVNHCDNFIDVINKTNELYVHDYNTAAIEIHEDTLEYLASNFDDINTIDSNLSYYTKDMDKLTKKNFYKTLRMRLTNKENGPSIGTIISLLTRSEVIKRLYT